MWKKIKKIGKWFLTIILFGFIVFEFYYYGIIDFRDGRNLTTGEVEFLSEIYGENINYNKAKVYGKKFIFSPFQSENTAVSPNGNIYFSEKFFQKDFSKANVWDQAWLVHEVMHVKQYQETGQILLWKAIPLQLNYILFGVDPYPYKIDFLKNLDDYNLEQQGDIARDYFLYLKGSLKLSLKEVEWYKNILK